MTGVKSMAKKDVLKGRSIVGRNIFEQANQSIDEIKRNNPLLDWFKSKGIEFKSSGNGQYMGLCPFHDDHNPSLSVSIEKNVFKCFGCGKSGTVLDAVSLFENISIGEAIKKLSIESREIKLFQPEEAKTEGKKFNLNDITEYYHKKLFTSTTLGAGENPKATDYLKSRGLVKGEIYQRFKIGFSDGSLLNVIGENQKRELTEAGILNQYGYETFNNCVIFPIFDDMEQTVGIYGRSINPESKYPHIYLKGKHRGIFNRKASKVYDEIILTECIIDCLSLIEIGFDNVQPIYGVNGFTDEHLQTLKDDRVKTVILAFDNDNAGINAGEKIKEKLLEEGFKVKIIIPPVKKDWNEELKRGIIKEEIEDLINKAEIFQQKEEEKKEFHVKKEGVNYIFTIGEIIYRIFDVKELSISNLKVSIKAEYQEEKFPDKIDLYSSRSRNSFSLTLSQKFNVETKRIEKDLLQIVDYLEAETMKRLSPESEEKQDLTEEERRIGTEFLKSADIFDQIIKDMEILGYVGEDLNKLLLYIAATSRIMDDPISVMIISQSAAGKSLLVDTLRKLLPHDEVVALTSLSDQALNYIGDLLHKFLIMGEAVHNELIEHQIREMLSNKELSRLVTNKDEKTGKMKSENIVTKAIVSMAIGGTRYDVNPENASRFFIVNADETIEQTRRIHEKQKDKYSIERKYIKEDVIPDIIKKHQSAQRLLNKITIVNPFRSYLNFPDTTMRSRRDFDRFIDLIACVCFLRQYQKERKTDGRFNFIECDLTDYEIAYRIMIGNVLPATMSDIPIGATTLYEEIRKIVGNTAQKNKIKPTEVNFIQRDIREQTGLHMDTIKKNLRVLVENEYIQLVGGASRGTRFSYKLRDDKPIDKLDLSMIPTPLEMGEYTKTTKSGDGGEK